MKHALSSVENTRQGFESLAALAKAGAGLLGESLVLDFSQCSFFAANMAAPLGAVLARIEDGFNEIEIEGIRKNVTVSANGACPFNHWEPGFPFLWGQGGGEGGPLVGRGRR
jgi:hypothetical protein